LRDKCKESAASAEHGFDLQLKTESPGLAAAERKIDMSAARRVDFCGSLYRG
jgi:hypothetical protein